jgi:Na+/H+ antiporter NhaD/arsenite permease-like protein
LQFFFWTGSLSAVLDTAPTYLAFLSAAFGQAKLVPAAEMPAFIQQHGLLLKAISIGAVFFGAATYIGNGPNLMVKKIAEQQRVRTPSFLGYIAVFSIPLLLPLFALVALLFEVASLVNPLDDVSFWPHRAGVRNYKQPKTLATFEQRVLF